MAINIDELQVETQAPASPPDTSSAKAEKQPEPDIHAELEQLRERELRLKAD